MNPSLLELRSVLWCLLSWLALAACDSEGEDPIQEPIHYLVSKVYNGRGDLVAEYTYDAKNRLIRCSFKDALNTYDVDLTLEYEDGLVQRIDHIDHIYPWLSHEKRYFYDGNGTVSRLERWAEGRFQASWSVSCDAVSQRCSLSVNGQQPRTYYEVKNNNVVSTTNHLIDLFNDEASQQVISFQYDTGKKPNFGLDYLVGIRLLPYTDSKTLWETSLSDNNLISVDHGNYTYTITYNDGGYPDTITEKIKGIEVVDPQLLRIEYW